MSAQPQTDRTLHCFAPSDGRRLATLPIDGPGEVADAIGRSRAAQRAWGERSVEARVVVLRAFVDMLLDRGHELARLLALECGKPETEAYGFEVANLLNLTGWFCANAPKMLAPKRIPLALYKNRRSELHYKPLGVVGIISPWNFPLIIPMGEVVIALLAGNGVVLKPSEETPLIALKAVQWLEQCGVPPGLVNVVIGAGETGAALVTGGVDKIVFTGGTETGRKVAVAAAQQLIPCALELGGKAPALILPDADLERTAKALVWGGFVNSGQVCCAIERVYVHRSQHDALVSLVVDHVRRLRHGDPLRAPVDVGAVIRAGQIDIAKDLIRDAVARGAVIEAGGGDKAGPGQFFELTVLSGVDDDARVMRDEIFGPVLPFAIYDDVEDAIRRANDSDLGLTAYVYGGDAKRCREVALRLEAGTVMVGDAVATYGMPETPWHGIKKSGIGVVHSEAGLHAMCRVLHLNTPRVSLPREAHWFPYHEITVDLARRAMAAMHGRGWRRIRLAPVPKWDADTDWKDVLPDGVG